MAPHVPTSEASWPTQAYPGRPYDWAAPYDWALEDALKPVPVRWSSAFEGLKDMFMAAGAIALVATVVSLAFKGVDKSTTTLKEAQKIPPTLPAAVGRKAAAAVKVRYNYGSGGGEGSGVKIGPDVVLTAGHVVLARNPRNELDCDGSYTLNAETPGIDMGDQIINRRAVYADQQDLAVLRVRQNPFFDTLPEVRLADEQPEVGDAVFFINYETGPPAATENHYPNPYLANPTPYYRGANYGHSAKYAGTVIGVEESELTVATGEAGYGPEAGREVHTYAGASGGQVLDSAGDLIGILVASGGSERVSDIGYYDGVKLQPRPRVRQISIVQPITEAILQPHIAGLSEKPLC